MRGMYLKTMEGRVYVNGYFAKVATAAQRYSSIRKTERARELLSGSRKTQKS